MIRIPGHPSAAKDLLFFPLRATMSDDALTAMGLTSMKEERVRACLRECRGRVLDVGCGSNDLVRRYGRGVGVDVQPWPGTEVVCDSSRLPFPDASFDTVLFIACLNHMSNRDRGLREARRVLKADGRLLATMINPAISFIGHTFFWRFWDPDLHERGMHEGEVWGFWHSQMELLLRRNGFRLERRVGFVYGLNTLYIGVKTPA